MHKELHLQTFSASFLESLVFSKVSNGESQRIYQQHVVRNTIAKDVDDIRRPKFSSNFRMIDWASKYFVEVDASSIGRRAQVFDCDVLNFDFDIWQRRVAKEGF